MTAPRADAAPAPAERILVIGATSAIAAETARIWAARGAKLFLVARNAERLQALTGELGSAVAGTSTGDFEHLDEAARHVERAVETLGAIDVALIAHGWLPDQRATERDIAAAARAIALNFSSAIAFAIPLANHFEQRRKGQLAVITSVAGLRGRPRNYTYGAAKRATSTWLEGARSRLERAGVRVHDLRLGPVDTPMTAGHAKNPLFAQPPAVARAIVRAIDRGHRTAYVPAFWRPVMWVVRALPEPLFARIGFLSGPPEDAEPPE